MLWLFVATRVRGETISKQYFAIGALAIVAAVAYKASALSSTDVTFVGRMALQGEVFYALLNTKFPEGFVDTNALAKYASAFFSMDTYRTTADYGFGRLMYVLMGPDAYAYIDDNVRLTAGYPATIIYHANYVVAMIVNFLLLFLFVRIFVRSLFQILRMRMAIPFVLYYKIYMIFGFELLVMGDYGQLRFKALGLLLLIMLYAFATDLWRRSGSPPVSPTPEFRYTPQPS
jgi:hypothetical protein